MPVYSSAMCTASTEGCRSIRPFLHRRHCPKWQYQALSGISQRPRHHDGNAKHAKIEMNRSRRLLIRQVALQLLSLFYIL